MSSLKYKNVLGLLFAVVVSGSILLFRDQIAQLSGLGYIGLFLINVFGSATLFLPTPLFLTTVAAAAVLNPFWVTVIAAGGSTIGELTGYVAGKSGSGYVSGHAEKVTGWMEKYGAFALILLAAIPNPLFDVAGIVAGATNVPVWKYLVALFIGKLIKFGVLAFFGFQTIRL